jgi:PAS domain S-box-containing protein
MKNNHDTAQTDLIEKIRKILEKNSISVSDKVTIEALVDQVGKFQSDLKQQTHDLGERVKELNGLYGLSRIMENSAASNDELMQQVTGLLTDSLQYPEIACARIHYGDKEFTSPNFDVTPWALQAKIVVSNKKRGELEVYYLTKQPRQDEGPFLKEERILINTIAKNLGYYLEKKESEVAIAEGRERLIKAQQIANMGDFTWNIESGTIFWSDTLYELLGYSKNESFDYTRINEEIHHPDDLEWVTNWLQECIDSGKTEYEPMEYRLIKRNGEIIYVQTHVTVKYENGQALELFGTVQNITKRKMAESDRRKSEENLRITLHSIGDAVISTDMDGNVVRMNPVAEKLTGWQEKEARGRNIEKIFLIRNALNNQPAENPVIKVLQNGKIVGLANHTKLISKDGTEYQIADSGAPILDDSGKITGVVLVFRDVTGDYQIQQQLKENEKRFRTMVEGAPDPIFIQSEMKFVYLNPAACRLFGIKSAGELLGKPVMDRFHPDYHEKIKQRIHSLNEKKDSVHQLLQQKFIRMDGSEVWVETAGEPIYYEGKHGALVFVRDVSQRKKVEEEFRENERRLSTLLNNLPGMAYRCINNDVWTMEFVSSGCRMLTGYSQPELQNNTTIAYGELIHPDDREYVWKEVQAANREKRSFVAEYRITGKNGVEKWVWEKGRAVDDKHLEGFIMDITIRKKAEMELKEKISELEKFNRSMVGRENRMIELKQEINELLEKLGQNKKYRVPDENEEK